MTPLRLTLLALGCGLLVSITHAVTKDRVAVNRSHYAARQLLEVGGGAGQEIVPLQENRFVLKRDGIIVGFIAECTTDAGYNGHISFWLALDTNGEVLGVRIKEHEETPGLGDKIELAVSDWVLSFAGAGRTTRWDVRRKGGDFDQFTGATITPRAVIHAVEAGRNQFLAERDELMEEASRGT